MTTNIPLSVVQLGPEVEQSVSEVLRSGIIAQGPKVAELERMFAALIGVDHVVAVNNGTTALIAAVQVLDLEPGDEVITSPFTFVATLNAIIAAGAHARFADISATDFNLDPSNVPGLLTDRTKALMPVHLYGQCADMESIVAIANTNELAIVEDAAQAHGAKVGDASAGSWGLGCFSLYATKNITSGEGGLISTNDAALADTLRVLRNQGMRQRYQYEMVGHNYRLTDLQAAVCVPQLSRYAEIVESRQANAAALSDGLGAIEGVTVPTEIEGRSHVWHQYTILVDESARRSRDELVDDLTADGIGCGIYYPKVVYDYDCYRTHPQVSLDPVPVADQVVARCLSLPVHAALSTSDIDRIVTTIAKHMGA